MQFKIHINDPSNQERSSHPIATIILTDDQKHAHWLPERVDASARFFLERVETESEDVERRILSAVQKPFVILSRSSYGIVGAVRTRGDYSTREPYGTPAYWRATIGRLERETGLTENLEEYGNVLQQMESAVHQKVATKHGVATRGQVIYQCSLYIIHSFGSECWAGKASFDESQQQWTVPIHNKALGEDISIGKITLNAQGKIVNDPLLPNKVQVEYWFQKGLEEKLLAVAFVMVALKHIVINLPVMKTRTIKTRGDRNHSKEEKVLTGIRVDFEDLEIPEVSNEPMSLELQLFSEGPEKNLKIKFLLAEGKHLAHRNQQLILKPQGEGQTFVMQWDRDSSSFAPINNSPDPFISGVPEGIYTLVLKFPINGSFKELRIPNLNFAVYAQAITNS